MVKTLVAFIATAVIGLVLPASPSAASTTSAEECYGPAVGTTVTIDADARVAPGSTVRASIRVRANTEGPVTGTLTVRVGSSVDDARSAPARTHAYTGTPVAEEIGPLARGSHVILAAFTPADRCELLGSGAVHRIGVGTAAQPPAPPAGVLPDTGGPSPWWLLLGTLLLAGGAGAVHRARRRTLAG